MRLAIMYFGSSGNEIDYQSLLRTAQHADTLGFSAVWLPERHFADLGAAFPNPSVLAAAVATVTTAIDIRCGSIVSPLHDVIRIAEEWSLIDRLSGGRAGLSFGSGWNADDFVLAPGAYDDRKQLMWTQIDQLRTLWRGEPITRTNGRGQPTAVSTQPRPVTKEPPLWVTVSGSPETAQRAAKERCGLLTHLVGKSREGTEELIAGYREVAQAAGTRPQVTLMLHAYADETREEAVAAARRPLREYLRSAVSLEIAASIAGGAQSAGRGGAVEDADPEALEELLEIATDNYLRDRSLIGGKDEVLDALEWAEDIGVDEIACLVDFGLDTELVTASLTRLSCWTR